LSLLFITHATLPPPFRLIYISLLILAVRYAVAKQIPHQQPAATGLTAFSRPAPAQHFRLTIDAGRRADYNTLSLLMRLTLASQPAPHDARFTPHGSPYSTCYTHLLGLAHFRPGLFYRDDKQYRHDATLAPLIALSPYAA
jgi:hypothetical protein